jgi:hypothetical protein
MGEKKKKEAAVKSWKKALFIIAAILFVVVMVVSSMGSHWITGLAPIKAGDAVVLDYTIYDAAGTPFLTTNQQLYKDQAAKGIGMLFGKQITVTANQSLRQAIFPVQVYSPVEGGMYQEFAIYNPEYNLISNAVVGMKTNEKKKVSLQTGNTMTTMLSPEDLKAVRVNMSALQVGDSMLLGVSETQDASKGNTSAVSYIRLGQVSRISDAGAVVEFGYPYAEITVASFGNK